MRRGFASLLTFIVLGLMTPAAFGQYPYPYGPMPYAPMPPYGYPGPMPAYGPNPMMGRPMYYPPAPMMRPPGTTKVFVYGPLDESVSVAPARARAQQPYPPFPAPKREPSPTGVSQVQATMMPGASMRYPTYSRADLIPEGCGPDCQDGSCGSPCGPECSPVCGPACGPTCDRPSYVPPTRGRGHFIGEVGAYFLVPVSGSRPAYSSATGGAPGTNTDFPDGVVYGARGIVGYMFHCGWGVRVNYQYLRGNNTASVANTNPATQFTTPLGAPFQFAFPSAALAAGVGTDQYTFTQRLDLYAGDIEVMKERHWLDTTFLCSFGARYTRVTQSYTASRTNGGAANGAVDREDIDSSSRFEGWGPTVSLEVIHPLGCGFSAYANARGSFIWGINRFSQNYSSQNGPARAVAASVVYDDREVWVLETEAGLQYGHRLGRCYLYTRVGAVYQRWWDVGSPTGPNGNLDFVGGTARIGITY